MGNYKDDRNRSNSLKIHIPDFFIRGVLYILFIFLFSCGGSQKFDTTPPVGAITGDNYGRVYVSTGDKICIFDGKEWKNITLPEKYFGTKTLAVDHTGTIWAGGVGGVYKITGERIDFISEIFKSLKCQFTSKIIEDHEDNIWFAIGCISLDPAYWWGGIMRLKDNTWTAFPIEDSIVGIASDKERGIYAFSFFNPAGSVLYKFDGTQWNPLDLSLNIHFDTIYAIAFDKGGSLWLVGFNGILQCISDTECLSFPVDINPSINAIDVDDSNNLWIGTHDGLVKFDGVNYVIYTRETTGDKLGSDEVTSVKVIGNTVWVGTTSGLSSFDGETWTRWEWDGEVWHAK